MWCEKSARAVEFVSIWQTYERQDSGSTRLRGDGSPLLRRQPWLSVIVVDAGGAHHTSRITTGFRSTLRRVCQDTNLVGRTGAYLSCLCCTAARSIRAARYAQEHVRRFREADTRRTMPPWTCRFANAVEQRRSHRCSSGTGSRGRQGCPRRLVRGQQTPKPDGGRVARLTLHQSRDGDERSLRELRSGASPVVMDRGRKEKGRPSWRPRRQPSLAAPISEPRSARAPGCNARSCEWCLWTRPA